MSKRRIPATGGVGTVVVVDCQDIDASTPCAICGKTLAEHRWDDRHAFTTTGPARCHRCGERIASGFCGCEWDTRSTDMRIDWSSLAWGIFVVAAGAGLGFFVGAIAGLAWGS